MAEGHKPKMMLLQVEEMDQDLREYVGAENCSMSTQIKLDSFVCDTHRKGWKGPPWHLHCTGFSTEIKTNLRKLQMQLQIMLNTL